MNTRLGLFAVASAALFTVLNLVSLATSVLPGRSDLPSRFSDPEFWGLTSEFSEGATEGKYASDNLLSNEMLFSNVLPQLTERVKPGGVFLGVGPEQNFTYIAALRPAITYVIDIRPLNQRLHLMYKAVFELSTNRADFLSRLFARARLHGVGAKSSAVELMEAARNAEPATDAELEIGLRQILDVLAQAHGFPLSTADRDDISKIYRVFHRHGPAMNAAADFALGDAFVGRVRPTYRDQMTQTAPDGEGLTYLGSEERFAIVKDLQHRNLVIPVVGDFAGPKAMRAIGSYLNERGASVAVFYLSNVETYLRRAGSWNDFCANLASLPLTPASTFVRVITVSLTSTRSSMSLPRPLPPSLADVLTTGAYLERCQR